MAIPLLCLLGAIVAEVLRTSHEVNEVLAETDMATAAIGPGGLMTGLQDERNWAVVELIGQQDFVTLSIEDYAETRRRTDVAIEAFSREVASKGGVVAEAYGPALQALADLQRIRDDIDANTAERTLDNNVFAESVFDGYAGLIIPFQDGNTRLALGIDDPTLRRGVELIDLSSRQVETVANLVREILQGELDGGITRDDVRRIAALADQYERYDKQIAAVPAPYGRDVAQGVPAEFSMQLSGAAETAIGGTVDITEVLDVADTPVEDSYNGLRDAVAARLDSEAGDLAAAADRRISLFRALGAVAFVLAGLATWIVSLSITKPLDALTRQATDMAQHRLPDAVTGILETPLGEDVSVPPVEPVAVQTQDEVADVAGALNTVQDSALKLAVEQAMLRRNIADSFVNLGRRNQNLLGRQLDFITELESNETDPDALANLFRLDHLATRMRRNAESLLLLAGVDPPRTWTQPVRINDVIRAALGEVEDFQRVVDRGVEPAEVQGVAAADLAHLLAELIDNALNYSPPDQAVEVRGGRRAEHGYTLAVIDAGLGMLADELAQANRRLAGAESFTIAPSKYLGHYVAGHLAARHGITVALHSSPGGGITAVVTLPTDLLVDRRELPQMMPAPTF